MQNLQPLVSLCIATNGVVEWVTPVLESIYAQGQNDELFEVVITDNGNSDALCKIVSLFKDKHSNLTYQRNNSKGFQNQINAFSLAKGKLLKFINHRSVFLKNSLSFLIKFAEENENEKPVVFFSDGRFSFDRKTVNDFDLFMYNLSYWSTWSGGTTIWKDDFDTIVFNNKEGLFPHCNMLFAITKNRQFIIDNTKLFHEVSSDLRNKGKYNIFYAFSVEYLQILLSLVEKRCISLNTFLKLKDDIGKLLSMYYFDLVLRKKPCSYDLSDYSKYVAVFYGHGYLKRNIIKAIWNKFSRRKK